VGGRQVRPQKLGKYVVVGEVGQGGMATVYKARDEVLGKTVAIKVLRPELIDGEQYLDRFKREAQIVASLEHPNIVSVFDYGCQDGLYYFVMTYVEGVSVYDLVCRNGRLPVGDGLRVCLDILSALGYAHERDVIHRDLKPENFMISRDGITFLADFGIARPIYGSKLTRISQRVGTPIYMSPEQVKGGVLDARSDIYAVGIALFEMLTGKLPFEGKDDIEIGRMHVTVAPPRPSRLNPELGDALEMVILKSLEKEPRRRYQTAKDMSQALVAAARACGLVVPEHAEPDTMASRLKPIRLPDTDVVAEPPSQAQTVDEFLVSLEGQQSERMTRTHMAFGAAVLVVVAVVLFGFYTRFVSLVTLTTIPPGAEVEEGPILWRGCTPFVMQRMLVGERKLSVIKRGYRRTDVTIDVRAGRLTNVNVVLQPEP